MFSEHVLHNLACLFHVKYTYLCKLVYLLDHSSKQSTYTLINQTLHVVNRLLVRQVQSELVLHLEAKQYHSHVQSEIHLFKIFQSYH